MLRSYFWVPMRAAYTHEERNYSIIQYGRSNTYPQEVLYALNRSSMASACVKAYKDFVNGDGFEDESYGDTIINDKGDTVNDLLSKITKDYTVFKGYAIHFDVNLLGEYVRATWLPFWQVRLGLPNEKGQINHVRVWDNWGGESTRFNANPGEIQSIKLFNPNPKVIREEIEECGGIENYNGQVLYCVTGTDFYPACSFDPAYDQVLSQGELANFNKNFIKNKFSASTMIVNEDVSEDEETFLRNKRELEKMSGANQAGGIAYVEGKISSFDPNLTDLDKQHKVVSDQLDDQISILYNIPPVLLGRTRQGGFPNQDEIINSFDFYNGMTKKDRKLVSKSFEAFAANWQFTLSTTDNFKIIPKTFGDGRVVNS